MPTETTDLVKEISSYDTFISSLRGNEPSSPTTNPVTTEQTIQVVTEDNQPETTPDASEETTTSPEAQEILQLLNNETESPEEEKPSEETPAEDTLEATGTISAIPEGYKEFEVDEGKTVLVKSDSDLEAIKSYFLRQQDYTKKTMELAEERKQAQLAYENFLKAKDDIEAAKHEIITEKEKYVFGLPNIPKPLESEYIDVYADREEQQRQREEYRKDLVAWETLQEKKSEFKEKRLRAESVALEINDKFKSKYGEEAFESASKELQKYYKAIKNDHVMPLPKDALEIFYKGKNYETLLADEKKKWLEELKAELKKKPVTSKAPVLNTQTNGTVPVTSGTGNRDIVESDRYSNFVNKLKSGR